MSVLVHPEWAGLALVGYRGTGKSSVGRLLAKDLGRAFVDADVALETRMRRTIRSIFETEGEPAFRDWEADMLAELTAIPAGKVLATGGGAVIRKANREVLRQFGHVVWLRARPETLAGRLRYDESRPALTRAGTLDEIADVLTVREPLYREVADSVIDTDNQDLGQVADQITLSLMRLAHSWQRAGRDGGVIR